jgi:hypothetical protein
MYIDLRKMQETTQEAWNWEHGAAVSGHGNYKTEDTVSGKGVMKVRCECGAAILILSKESPGNPTYQVPFH